METMPVTSIGMETVDLLMHCWIRQIKIQILNKFNPKIYDILD